MPRSKEISDEVRRKVVAAHEAGKGYKTISKVCELHRSTVRQIIYKWKTFNTVSSRPRSGRPTKIASILCSLRRRDENEVPESGEGVSGGSEGEETAPITGTDRGANCGGLAAAGEDKASMTLVLPDVSALTRKTTKRIRRKEKLNCNRELGSAPPSAERHMEVMLCCKICGTCCTTETDLESHQAQHLDKTLHQCEECGRAFQTATGLRAHRKRKHGC
ncbi:uncharacterized protein LOC143766748 [Ranitomeya variabilis]|uniref:uncharacterized protein LOC143766748 n=1 Tax=Ranitomeya variabilis TaxID=490064 RepID=UPI0040569EB5